MYKALAIALIGLSAVTTQAADSGRNFIAPPGVDPKAAPPYSNGVMVDGAFYIAGHLGVDPATGKVAADPEAEAHLMMDAVKQTLERGGLSMADMVSVTVYCTDVARSIELIFTTTIRRVPSSALPSWYAARILSSREWP